jgi:hypothetical protein
MPAFVNAAKSSYWFPPSQFATFLPFIFGIELMPELLHVSWVIPERVKICALLTSGVFASRAASRLGSQSTPNCAWPLATTCSGMMSGPPFLSVTLRPCLA